MWTLIYLILYLGLIMVCFYFLNEAYRKWTRKIEESQCFWRRDVEDKLDKKMIEVALALQESLVEQRTDLQDQLDKNFDNCREADFMIHGKLGVFESQLELLERKVPVQVHSEILDQMQRRFIHMFKDQVNPNQQFMCYYCQHWFPMDELDQQGKYSYCSQHGKMRSNHVHHSG